jgi:hypothetical protein
MKEEEQLILRKEKHINSEAFGQHLVQHADEGGGTQIPSTCYEER